MADILQTGVAFLLSTLSAHASRSITYQRGSIDVTLTATLGRSEWEQATGDGGIMRMETRDYIIAEPEIPTIGLPAAGDLVMDEGITYEVLPVGTMQAYRHLDPFRLGLRIHTKKIALSAGSC